MTSQPPQLELAYVSRARSEFDDEALAKLEERCREQNAPAEIRTVIVHAGDAFAQLLEGPEVAVRATLERIRDDERHVDLRILFERTIETPRLSSADTHVVSLNNPTDDDNADLEPLANALVSQRLAESEIDDFVRAIDRIANIETTG